MKKVLLLFLSCCYVAVALGEEPIKGYRGYFDVVLGDAYNLNTAQTISTNNMQLYGSVSTTHGYRLGNWFVGGGAGYYHSFRDKENMYPIYAAGRYTIEKMKQCPYFDVRAGVIYDPYWIENVQKYGAISAGMNVFKSFQIGLILSIYSRPSRFFTANAAVVLEYSIGK